VAQHLKHDAYVEVLCERIRADYDQVYLNVPVFSKARKKRKIGEIDLLAEKDGKYDVYEVKCSFRLTKARKQLQKMKRVYPNVDNCFFFCGKSGLLTGIL